jgi:hypothetical protein
MIRARLEEARGDDGMTMVELIITSFVLILLLGMVFVSMSMIDDVSTNVSSQYEEFDQALPALAPFHNLLAAQIEPGPAVNGVPVAPIVSIGSFSLTFYANIGTAYNNALSCAPSQPTCAAQTAGPARIVASERDQAGDDVTSTSTCSAASPCSLQVRMYLPQTDPALGAGAPTCPVDWGSSVPQTVPPRVCTYGSSYRLLANVQDVVNNPNPANGSTNPVFTYTYFDPGATFTDTTTTPATVTTTSQHAITLTPTEVDNQLLTGLSVLGYPADTQSLTACGAASPANSSAPYVTQAFACPLDAIQSIGVDVMVAKPGATSQGAVENSVVVYRYAQSPGSSTAPYQYSETQG